MRTADSITDLKVSTAEGLRPAVGTDHHLNEGAPRREVRGTMSTFNIKAVNVDDISTDGYQRDFSLQKAEEIAKHFNLAEWDFPKVAPRNEDGLYLAVAGQHRVGATRILRDIGKWPFNTPIGYVEVIVLDGIGGTNEQADLFLSDATNKKPLTPFDKHRAGVIAGKEMALDIQDALDAVGLRLVRRQKQANGKTVSCTEKLQAAWSHGRRAGLAYETVYHTLRLASMWNQDDVFRFNGYVVGGLSMVVRDALVSGKSMGVDPYRALQSLTRFVKKNSATKVHSQGHLWAVKHNVGITTPVPYANAIRDSLGMSDEDDA